MTDVRRVPWRLPQGYEGLKFFWDEFIKKLGANIETSSGTVGQTASDDAELLAFFHGD